MNPTPSETLFAEQSPSASPSHGGSGHNAQSHGSPPTTPDSDHAAIMRLEQALAAEVRISTGLRDNLDALRARVEQMETSFLERLESAARASAAAEQKLADQQKRLVALGSGREESMRMLADARAELGRVSNERDQLRNQVERLDGFQAATVTLREEDIEEPSIYAPPSMEELMASLSAIEEARMRDEPPVAAAAPSQFFASSESVDESQEMISPELVFPEEYGQATSEQVAPPKGSSAAAVARVLVFLDGEQPIKYPLYKRVMTIGRSTQADIQVNGDFISRVHARVVSTEGGVVVEDVDSKNGIRVNSKPITRHSLQHGDVIGLGKLRFTYVDTAAE